MYFTRAPVCVLWYLLIPVIGALYTCEGPNDLVAEWPTEEELKTFNETTEGKQPLVSIFSTPASSGLTIYFSRFHSNLLKL